jgi:hypothetical protein
MGTAKLNYARSCWCISFPTMPNDDTQDDGQNAQGGESVRELTCEEVRAHNKAQFARLTKIKEEIKWLVGEELHYDPDSTPEGRARVELYLAECLKDKGTGEYLAELVRKMMKEKEM